MSALFAFASPIDSTYHRTFTRLKAGIGVARLSSPRTINALTGLTARAERTVSTADLRSSLLAVWKALLVGGRNAHQLVVGGSTTPW